MMACRPPSPGGQSRAPAEAGSGTDCLRVGWLPARCAAEASAVGSDPCLAQQAGPKARQELLSRRCTLGTSQRKAGAFVPVRVL